MFLHSKKTRWPDEVVATVKKMREEGLSYGEISRKTGISRSTLFAWIGGTTRIGYVTKRDKEEHLRRIRVLAVNANKKNREEKLNAIIKKVETEVGQYNIFSNKAYLKSLISMLYWAEGTKVGSSVKFANTDPKLILLFVTLLKKCFSVDEGKIKIRLHLHYYHPVRETRKYWSALLNIPESQFGKIYIKPRSKTKKFRKNFRGICFVIYHNSNLKFEIMERAYKIADNLYP